MNKKQAASTDSVMPSSKGRPDAAAWTGKPWEMPRFRNWISVAKVYQSVCRIMSEQLAPLGLKLPHYDIMATIARYPDLSQQELANRLLVGRSNLSMLLPELESRGYVARVADAEDKRIRRLRLTPEGKALTLEAIAVHVALIERMMSVSSEEECNMIGEQMRRMGAELAKK